MKQFIPKLFFFFFAFIVASDIQGQNRLNCDECTTVPVMVTIYAPNKAAAIVSFRKRFLGQVRCIQTICGPNNGCIRILLTMPDPFETSPGSNAWVFNGIVVWCCSPCKGILPIIGNGSRYVANLFDGSGTALIDKPAELLFNAEHKYYYSNAQVPLNLEMENGIDDGKIYLKVWEREKQLAIHQE